jgi:hypothetical protein
MGESGKPGLPVLESPILLIPLSVDRMAGQCDPSHMQPLAAFRLLILMAILVLPASVFAQLPAALFGEWELNVEKSAQTSARIKRTTCKIEPWEDGLKVSYDSVGQRGGVLHLEWRGRFDGQDYMVQGVDYVLTNAYTQVSDSAYRILVKVDGRVVATAETSLSPDGQTLRTLTRERTEGGGELESLVVYERR